MKKFDIQRFAKRRIQVGDNLTNVIIYSDIPDDYLNLLAEKANGVHRTFISAADSSNMSIADGYVDGDAVVQIDYPNDRDHFYNAWLDNGEIHIHSKLDQLQINFPDGNVASIDDTNESYRHLYIEDSNIRPIRAKDVINENTKIYFTWPDTLTLTDRGTTAVLYFNSLFQINYVPGENFKIEAISNLSIEERIVLFNSASNINKSYLDLSEFEEGASIAGTIEFQLASFPQEVLNGILVDETTLTSSGPEPTDPTLIFPTNIRRVQIGDNLFQKYIYSDFPWEFDDTIRAGGDLTIIDTIGHENSFYTILLPESGNSIIKTVNKDIEYYLYWRENNQDNSIFGKRRFFIGENDTEANKNNYTVTSLYLDGASWGKGAYRCLYIEDPNIRPIQVGDKIIEGTQLYFNFPDNPDSWLTGKYSCDVIKCGDKTIMYYVTEQPVSRATSTISSISLESNDMYAFDLNTLEISKNLSSYIIKFYYQDAVSYVDDKFQQYILVDTTTLGEAPLISTGTISYKNNGNWNKLLSLAQEQVPLKGSIMPGPIKWSAVNSTTECTDSKTLYFVFGEEETNPTYETLTAQAKGATYGDSIFGGSGSHTLVVKNSDSEQNEYPYTVSSNGSGFYTDLEFSVVTNKPFQLGITFSYGLDTSMSSNQVSLGATLLDLISSESFSFNTVVTGTEGVGQTYWFPTTNSSGTQLTFDWLKNANLRITSSVSEYGQACLSGDTKIKTLNNDIYISDLELGDKVIDKDNQETEITKIYNHKIDTVYQIHLDNDETIECSYDHKFLVNDEKAVTAAQLKENDKLGQHTITSIDIINKELDVYEIKTESNTYTLANGIICECENI